MGNSARKYRNERNAIQNRLDNVLQDLHDLDTTTRSKENEIHRLKSEMDRTTTALLQSKEYEMSQLKLKMNKAHEANLVKINNQRERDFEQMRNKIKKYQLENDTAHNKLESVLQELEKTKSKLVKTNEQRQRDFEQMENTVLKYKVENEAAQNKLGSVLQELEKTKSLLKSKEYEVSQLESKMTQTTKAPAPPDDNFQHAKSIFNNKTQSRSLINTQNDIKAEKTIDELEREIKKIGEEYKELKRENEKLENELKKKTKQFDKLALENDKIIADFKRTSGKGIDRILSDENLRLKDEMKQLQIENKEQKSEIDQWKLRLSKVAGERMVHGNTAITDLGDKYRPQKLSEMFVSLYDDKWTDAFEVIKCDDDNEQHACKKLLKIFQNCWEFCLLYSKHQLEELQLSFINADIKDENTKIKILDNYPSQLNKLIKDTRRFFAHAFLPSLQQLYWKQDKTIMADSMQPFVKACIEICWHSAISDPALDYMFTADNLENFKTYTQSGSDVDYVVWPAMHLHKCGPLLSKGVVQFKKLTAKVQ